MFHFFRLWLGSFCRCFHSRQDLLLENLALRQQFAVLKRKHPRAKLSPLDKLFWVRAGSGPLGSRLWWWSVRTENSVSIKKVEVRKPWSESLGLWVHASLAPKTGKVSPSRTQRITPGASSAPVFLRLYSYIKEGSVSGGPSFVAVVQPADLGKCHDGSHLWRLSPSRLG